jgi:ATP-dependent protease ClpP protease subunit
MTLHWEVSAKALDRWNPAIKAKSIDKKTIDMYDSIGEGYYSEGVTLASVSKKLKDAGGEDIFVNINSAGGDMFEGLAIYNALRDYEGVVNIRIMGMAASAASVIAMAGDNVEISESSFLMIHNAWSIVVGNKEDFAKASEDFGKFDDAMSKVYSRKTGMKSEDIARMMSDETWIGGLDALEMGFADTLLDDDAVIEDQQNHNAKALRKVDTALAKAGVTRSERRDLIKELTSTPSAAEAMPSASDDDLTKALEDLQVKINSLVKGK